MNKWEVGDLVIDGEGEGGRQERKGEGRDKI